MALPVWGASGTSPSTAQLSPASAEAASSVRVGRIPSVCGSKRSSAGSLRSTHVRHANRRSPPIGVSPAARMRPRPGGRSPKPVKARRQVAALSSLTSTRVSSSAASLELPARRAATSGPFSSRTRLGTVQKRLSGGATVASKIVPLSRMRTINLTLCHPLGAAFFSLTAVLRQTPIGPTVTYLDA